MKISYTSIRRRAARILHMYKKMTLGMLLLGASATGGFAQGVGINTSKPDPSAALDIVAEDKGVLVPRVYLQNLIDKTTVVDPANGLMVYNTNAGLKWGVGFYFNKGTAASPDWRGVSDFPIPYSRAGSDNVMFDLQNYGNATSTAIHAYSNQGYALSTEGKIKIAGAGQVPGKGKVLTSDANGNATWQGGVAFGVDGISVSEPEIVEGVTTKIPFVNKSFDVGKNYNGQNSNPSNVFIAPIDGIYHFDLAVEIEPFKITAECQLLLIVANDNFEEKYAVHFNKSILPATTLKLSKDLKLMAGYQVYGAFYYYDPGDNNLDFTTSKETNYFTGHFVSPL